MVSGVKYEETDDKRECADSQNDILENTDKVSNNSSKDFSVAVNNTTSNMPSTSKPNIAISSEAKIQTEEDIVQDRTAKIKLRREKLIELLKKRQEWVSDIQNDSYCKKIKEEINILDEEELQLILSS